MICMLKYKDIIQIHKNNNQLENVSLEFLLQLRNDRNYFAQKRTREKK